MVNSGILEGFKKAGPLELPNDRQANPTFIEDLLPIIEHASQNHVLGEWFMPPMKELQTGVNLPNLLQKKLTTTQRV